MVSLASKQGAASQLARCCKPASRVQQAGYSKHVNRARHVRKQEVGSQKVGCGKPTSRVREARKQGEGSQQASCCKPAGRRVLSASKQGAAS